MYTLFKNYIGLWGIKDDEGNVVIEPSYLREVWPDGREVFTDKLHLEVLEFSPEEGFDIIAWSSAPWWDEGFFGYHYSKLYAEYVMKYCCKPKQPVAEMNEALTAFDGVESLKTHLVRLRQVAKSEIDDDYDLPDYDTPLPYQELYDPIDRYLDDESYPLFARESLAYLTFLAILYNV